ncbi:glutathione S-transferase 1-like [Musca vetustissima]|uniref:glutathione S-transferase 1-like n=1 Tax=Musca vetustissima TaxID=27455 RepID=UPI002AB675E5|nr:glutathione S-transferase 1-like [Musca vetustissima]
MSNPILYMATLSPPSRAVMLTAKAIGLELEYKVVNLLAGEHLTPEFLKMNPQHTIPTLVDGEDIIYDSHAICCYLVDKYSAADDTLYPKDLLKRAQVNARLHFDSGHLFARLRFLFEPILFFGCTEVSEDKIANLVKCWEIMEGFLQDHPYVCGDNMTIADLCCVATISSCNEVVPIDESKFPKFAAWFKRISQLPYYKDTNEVGAEELKAIFKMKLAENRAAQ